MPEEIFLSKDTHIKTKKIERVAIRLILQAEELYDLVNEIKKVSSVYRSFRC